MHVARRTALVSALVLVALLALPSLASAATIRPANRLERGIVREINAVRLARGLPPVHGSRALARAADRHSLQMARVGYFAHQSADGSAFWRRILRFYRFHGYSSWSVGENLLWRAPSVTPREALAMWLASPEHRKILLAAKWHRVGVGAVRAANAEGAYGGRDVVIVTADFGVRYR